ncbi:MAG: FAD:protein FMN transferase [Hoeflea sp.]|uniref:FAD:protein FMN transferase n=1 Tax=Hoeflea sp. TaxID=1940281 RepID=UPI001E1A4D02|nr:FAD:protein FMN transferase [Hoeflea sp.]MBU4530350.1 FAD:protein FMN transferase [Alphaproteobacteria bacterium]MBU4545137.1 FAD:protein FMN transferase [Alphaproteobacteria bacterium]MBU4549663.1 FAD:protein FMN transferase [Alphaproteobacteria bacterium]MBV1721940.1 FAD:protein FMN transferase [Hoeflea sp.]MBV1761290.1 FAD:protein FMN transferase [Hoeflea sp.]
MRLSRRRFITITAAGMLGAHHAMAADNAGARWQGVALGAHADLRLVGLPARDAERLLVAARGEIERLEQLFSLYRTDSALARLNAMGVLEQPGPDMLELCSLVSTIHQASSGMFDPSVQPLWAAYARARGVPEPKALEAARAVAGWSKVDISVDRIRLEPGAALTFNGIAQGFITDRVVSLLKAQGLEAGLVSVGEIAAVGAAPGGKDWAIGLAGHEDAAADATIHLRDKTVATSSPNGTLFGAGPDGHILDPRSGLAATARWRRVSVIHRSAAMADGLSTAGVLHSAEQLRNMARQFPGTSVHALGHNGDLLLV